MESIEEIVEYLNEKAGKRFRLAEKSVSLMSARLKNYTVDDMKRVIDSKCNEWRGNPDMEKYLRPQTLFNKSKFEMYFEQIIPESNVKLSARQIEHRKYILSS